MCRHMWRAPCFHTLHLLISSMNHNFSFSYYVSFRRTNCFSSYLILIFVLGIKRIVSLYDIYLFHQIGILCLGLVYTYLLSSESIDSSHQNSNRSVDQESTPREINVIKVQHKWNTTQPGLEVEAFQLYHNRRKIKPHTK